MAKDVKRPGDETFAREVGQRIAQERTKRRMTGAALAKKAGLSRQALSRIENGGSHVTVEQIIAISDALSGSVTYFILGKHNIETLGLEATDELLYFLALLKDTPPWFRKSLLESMTSLIADMRLRL